MRYKLKERSMRKAHSLTEVLFIALVVIGVSFFAFKIYNDIKLNLANNMEVKTKSGINTAMLDVKNPLDDKNANSKPDSDTETAGSPGTLASDRYAHTADTSMAGLFLAKVQKTANDLNDKIDDAQNKQEEIRKAILDAQNKSIDELTKLKDKLNTTGDSNIASLNSMRNNAYRYREESYWEWDLLVIIPVYVQKWRTVADSTRSSDYLGGLVALYDLDKAYAKAELDAKIAQDNAKLKSIEASNLNTAWEALLNEQQEYSGKDLDLTGIAKQVEAADKAALEAQKVADDLADIEKDAKSKLDDAMAGFEHDYNIKKDDGEIIVKYNFNLGNQGDLKLTKSKAADLYTEFLSFVEDTKAFNESMNIVDNSQGIAIDNQDDLLDLDTKLMFLQVLLKSTNWTEEQIKKYLGL